MKNVAILFLIFCMLAGNVFAYLVSINKPIPALSAVAQSVNADIVGMYKDICIKTHPHVFKEIWNSPWYTPDVLIGNIYSNVSDQKALFQVSELLQEACSVADANYVVMNPPAQYGNFINGILNQ